MCWRREAVQGWRPTPDREVVVEARDSLLRELAAEARDAPGDPWILGQQTRYLLEAGREEEALRLVRPCPGSPRWWCEALAGLTLHVQGRFPEAGAAFHAALSAMDPEEARRWTDVSALLDGGQRDFLAGTGDRSAPDPAASSGEARIRSLWALADPLFIVPGNDRYTEHLARQTMIRILSESATPHAIRWGKDMAELLLRYGWELGWARIAPRPGELAGPVRVVGYENPDARRFVPPEAVLENPTEVSEDPWTPAMWARALSGYGPTYAPVFLPMASRFLRFTRGEKALVAVTFQLPPDTTYRTREGTREDHRPPAAFRGTGIRSGLVLTGDGGEVLHSVLREGEAEGVLMLEVPSGRYLASAEVLDPSAGRAGRFRNGLVIRSVPPDLPTLSDLFLVEADSLPRTLLDGLSRVSIRDEAVAGEPLVVGWELWGLGWREETLTYRLSLERTHTGVLDRIRGLFGGGPTLPVLEWEEPGPSEPGPAFHSISLAGPEVNPGAYTLRLSIRSAGREPLVQRLRIRIVGPGGGEGGGPR